MPPDQSPAQHVIAAGEAIRAANHATLDPASLPAPGDVAETVLALCTLTDRLPQFLDQLAAAIVRHQRSGIVRMDSGEDPGPLVLEVETLLADAESDLPDITATLRKASGLLARMGTPYEAGSEGDE
ncbi:hypothetical protein M8Z33_07410 [Streptomyces sp. ZAF1911]|uniref:hypothetical protein n=1 Tax=Streptomyces sp. ZAF1911 TaxID=2944129 RepID=UPI00237BF52D|nr:hypothetical protein [Streptomyces sp. ZAF1911]MDD9376501.1 hypothetical protein [Streptomyces sp. ZAF1911]